MASESGFAIALTLGLPIVIGAGAGIFWGLKGFFRQIGEGSARGFNMIWIAIGIAVLCPVVLPFFFTRKG